MIRYINIGLLLAFMLCYLEWGQGNSSFIFQVEYELFRKKDQLLSSLAHPLILAGLAGQLLLLYAAFRKVPNKTGNTIGILILSPVVLLALLAGILSHNMKMVASTLPFIILSAVYFLKFRSKT